MNDSYYCINYFIDCNVNLEDYIRITEEMVIENGDLFDEERKIEEINRFKLIDSNNRGHFTWSEYLEFKTGELLSKRNKVIFLFYFLFIKKSKFNLN